MGDISSDSDIDLTPQEIIDKKDTKITELKAKIAILQNQVQKVNRNPAKLKYQKNNREELNNKNKEYRDQNKESIKEQKKQYYQRKKAERLAAEQAREAKQERRAKRAQGSEEQGDDMKLE